MDSIKGSFLVASPDLTDPNFARTVIFMVEHSAEGAFGLVLSRPTTVTLDELCDRIFQDDSLVPSRDALKEIPIFTGGPVQHSAVFFLHTLDSIGKESVNVDPGIYLGNQTTELQNLLARIGDDDPPRMRVFMGYSGWASGQLEREIRSGGWLVREATLEQVFELSAESLWSGLVSAFGGDLGIFGMMPADPELN